jgi:hypothetical protein
MTTDYIMRMIEEFGRGLARVLHLKDINQYENAMDELNNLTRKMVGFDLNQMKMFGLDGIKNFFDMNNYSSVEKVFYSAKALKEEALIFFDQGKLDEGKESAELSLGMFELLKDNGIKDVESLDEEINLIRNKIN